MTNRAPHVRLFTSTQVVESNQEWCFVLQAADGSQKLAVRSTEPDVSGEALELLAVVRALEALDEPSHVSLYTNSRLVTRGIREGLEEWRANGWAWEAYGRMVPIKHRQLWQRLDRALRYHAVTCRRNMATNLVDREGRTWRFDAAHRPGTRRAAESLAAVGEQACHTTAPRPASLRSRSRSYVGAAAGVARSSSTGREPSPGWLKRLASRLSRRPAACAS